jgi:hypothetical protein
MQAPRYGQFSSHAKRPWFDGHQRCGRYRDRMVVKWLDGPEPHDYDAAADYLSLIAESDAVSATVDALKSASTTFRKAKDILRAAQLALLTDSNVRVKGDLAKIGAGKKLSPTSWYAATFTPPRRCRSPTGITGSARVISPTRTPDPVQAGVVAAAMTH